jgi:hypothetical protein
VDFARISGTVTGYPQGASLCAILVIMILAIVVMTIGDRHGDRGYPGGQGVGRQGRRGARKLAWDYTTSTLLSASIHPTLENFEILRTSPFGHSRKLDFHFTEFSKVRYPQATPKQHQR